MTESGSDDFGVGGSADGGVDVGVVGFECMGGKVECQGGGAAAVGGVEVEVEVVLVEVFGEDVVEVVSGVGSLEVVAEGESLVGGG